MEHATGVQESLDHKIFHYLMVTFTVVGFFAIFLRLAQAIRLLLSLFVLPGKSVRSALYLTSCNID